MSHSLIARVRARFALASEAGFTLIEVMVAAGILLTSLLALAYTTTVSLSYTAFSRQRQGANGLANQTMEQVRALPFTRLESGLDNTDLANSATVGSPSYDSNITTSGCGGGTPKYCYGGEPIPHGNIVGTGQPTCGSSSLPHPLVPHRCSFTVGPTTYTVSVYVTNYIPPNGTLDLTSHTYRVTVVASWARPQVRGALAKVTTQSIFYSSSGCLSPGTHPFAAPCQPFLYASAAVQPGSIQVGGSIGSTTLDPGGILSLPQFSSDLQIEQISAARGLSQSAGASTMAGDQTLGSVGPIQIASGADSDPAQPGHEYDSKTSTTALSGGPVVLSGEGGDLSLSASGTDSLTTVSTTSAANGQSPACTNLAGTNQTDGHPCGNSKLTPGSSTSLTLTLSPDGSAFGSVALAAVAAATGTDVAYTKRLVAPNNPVCPSTAGDGCVHAEASRVIGNVTLAWLPAGLSPTGSPAGSWAGYLIQISGFSDHVSAEAGVGAAAPTAGISAGTVKYWTGSGYTTCSLASNCPSTIVTSAVSATTADGAVITIPSASLGKGVPTVSPASTDCPSSGPRLTCAAASPSPLIGDIVYEVSKDGSALTALTIGVNLGQLDAGATYKSVTAG
jgi:Tfp pilus assembly protein PilV